MRKLATTILLSIGYMVAYPQQKTIDSLLLKLDYTKDVRQDNSITDKILAIPHGDFALIKKVKQDFAQAERQQNTSKQLRALLINSHIDFILHDAPALLDVSLRGIHLSIQAHNTFLQRQLYNARAQAYLFAQDFHRSASYSLQAAALAIKDKDIPKVVSNLSMLESDYASYKNPDSALYYANEEIKLTDQYNGPAKWDLERLSTADMGEALTAAGRLNSALKYYLKSYAVTKSHPNMGNNDPYLFNNLARIYMALSKSDSALSYALESYNVASKNKIWEFTDDASGLLSKIYEQRNIKKSLYYLKAQMAARDSLNKSDKSRQFQLTADNYQQQAGELQAAKERYNSRVRLMLVIGAAIVFMIIGIMLWLINRKQKHTNLLLGRQKEQIETQRDNLSHALEDLKNTQTQLIQSEKMASLGELTAGIAHEIQNPLNFVNNFSEVNTEMISELEEELQAGNLSEALAITADIKENEQKITQHGKRADFIVKGMLQHSRTSTGERQLTNINLLADEFLKLSYHGLRAKDKSFNAELVTNFDANLPKINIVQQDIGRVLLNLFNNAFYAVNERRKVEAGSWKPEVTVSTKLENEQVVITVRDNGNGIPHAIKDKIMQPFFTTKPTGEGTGLGLSLSYDIVVKGHGGSIKVESVEGEGSEFTIFLQLHNAK